jgi:hypothetical protein
LAGLTLFARGRCSVVMSHEHSVYDFKQLYRRA